LAEEICAAGGTAEAAQVDALDEHATEEHVGAVAQKAGAVDVSFNAIGIPQQNIQGVPLAELSAEAFSRPIMTYPVSHFLTARAAGRRVADKGSGVILTLTATPARLASRSLEAWLRRGRPWRTLTRTLAAELGPQGVRVVCLRPDAILRPARSIGSSVCTPRGWGSSVRRSRR